MKGGVQSAYHKLETGYRAKVKFQNLFPHSPHTGAGWLATWPPNVAPQNLLLRGVDPAPTIDVVKVVALSNPRIRSKLNRNGSHDEAQTVAFVLNNYRMVS